jgi:hypothetical protein
MFQNLGIPKKEDEKQMETGTPVQHNILIANLQESRLYDSNPQKQMGNKRVGTVLPILQHNILLQYGRNTNTISTFCTSHDTIEYRSQGSRPRRADTSSKHITPRYVIKI